MSSLCYYNLKTLRFSFTCFNSSPNPPFEYKPAADLLRGLAPPNSGLKSLNCSTVARGYEIGCNLHLDWGEMRFRSNATAGADVHPIRSLAVHPYFAPNAHNYVPIRSLS
ncbi:hypothetical protein WG66_013901 [Moniliophthora roreri]|nr:hypothetical protein WG66_013901 [Moniliophthora roreri]